MMTTFKGIIFDFNGVLWWDNHLQEQSWRDFSAKVRGTPLSDEEMAVHMHGRNNQYLQEYLAGRPVTGQELAQLIEEKETAYRQLCLAQGTDFKLSPGAIELLDFLVDRHIPHTIATASGKGNLDFFIEHLDLGRWFNLDQIVYDDGSHPGKPAPDIYLQAVQNLGLAPVECMVVEDSHSGIQAAHAAQIGWVVALGPGDKHKELAALDGVDAVIENLGQILSSGYFSQ
jgi:beta-phosphoglucomutase-like phosphatase (HAD superfamily)